MSNTESTILSKADIEKLVENPSPEYLIEISGKIAKCYSEYALNQEQMSIADDIFRMLVGNIDNRIRKAVATHLQEEDTAPHDIIVSLANDKEDDIATPVIEKSRVLTDTDLIEIIDKNPEHEQRHMAITNRHEISDLVSNRITDTGNERVVSNLLMNPGAHISDGTMSRISYEFKNSDKIKGSIDARSVLAMANLTKADSDKINALCCTSITIFEEMLAKMSDVPEINTNIISRKGDNAGLQFLLKKANVPQNMFDSIKLIFTILLEAENRRETLSREQLIGRVRMVAASKKIAGAAVITSLLEYRH